MQLIRGQRRWFWRLSIPVCLLFLYFQTQGMGWLAHDTLTTPRNQTLGFQEIFVVNLAERTDRRDAMTLMAALTGLRLTYMDGVRGTGIPEKVLPPGTRRKNIQSPGKIGNWRAHMNVLQRIVRENITTALIMEDDLDWDVRLKSQCQTFALATQKYLQPLRRDRSKTLAEIYPFDSELARKDPILTLHDTPRVTKPKTSPYGDDWDILWMGHTGGELPGRWKELDINKNHPPRSLLTLTVPKDGTVPMPRHIRRHPWADKTDPWARIFPPHTRVVHESRATGGAQAYAVSQRGARRLLMQFGLEGLTEMWDVCLRDFCEGVFTDGKGGQIQRPVCVTTHPPLMNQYFSKGGSDLEDIGGGYFHKRGSIGMRYSVRVNMKTLLERKGPVETVEGLVDQWPDEGDGPW